MNRLPLSSAGAALLRAFLARSPQDRDRILLTEHSSVDWQSLTFIGERHRFMFRIMGMGAEDIFLRLTADLGEYEFTIPGNIVAEIALDGRPASESGGSIRFGIEALTIEE